MTYSAPGKLVLLGDYAVLGGGTAMVAAVDRRATAQIVTADVPASSVVDAVLRTSGRAVAGSIEIDTSSFQTNGQKLGLGSSAAAAVLSAALILESGGEDVRELAVDAHRAAADGRGSGVDVAASYHGGVIASRRQPGPVDPLPSRIEGLRMTVLFSGRSAVTSELVAACEKSDRWDHWMGVLGPLAEQGIEAWSRGEADLFLSVVDRYGRAMGAMGKDAGVNIVTDEIDAVIRLAAENGGAAKPSGAGGGDVVVMWSRADDLPQRIADRTGLELLDIQVDPRGLSRK